MAKLEITASAQGDLVDLIETRSLDDHDTRERVRRTLQPLTMFPKSGLMLKGRWDGHRRVVCAWGLILALYWYDNRTDTVVVVAFQDSRTEKAASGGS